MKAVGPIKVNSVGQVSTVPDKQWENSIEPKLVDASLHHSDDIGDHNMQSSQLS